MNTSKYIFCVILVILTSFSPANAQLDCCGGDTNTAAYWRCKAYMEADIYDWDLSKDLEFNKHTVVNVYNYYAELYLRKPNQFYWPALASVGGRKFVGAFQDIHILARDIELNRLSVNDIYRSIEAIVESEGAHLSTQVVGQLLNLLENALMFENLEDIARDMRFMEAKLLSMGKQIFDDMAWQHLAYEDGGLELVTDILNNDPAMLNQITITQRRRLIDAWEAIDSGDPRTGALLLAYHEQWIVIQDEYDEIWSYSNLTKTSLTIISWIEGPPVPNGRTFLDEVILDKYNLFGVVEFPTSLDITANVANAQDRWDWFEGNTIPRFADNLENQDPLTMNYLNNPVTVNTTDESKVIRAREDIIDLLSEFSGLPLGVLSSIDLLNFPLNPDERVEPQICRDCENNINGPAIPGTPCFQDPINQIGPGIYVNDGAGCECRPPVPQIQAYEGDPPGQEIPATEFVMTEDANKIQTIDFTQDFLDNIGINIPGFDANDKVRSLKLFKVPPGRTYLFYDSPSGSRQDDWVEIRTKQYIEERAITTLENSVNDAQLRIIYHRNNGLDGKVSRYESVVEPSGPTIDFYEGGNASQNLLCSVELFPNSYVDFTKNGACDNDEARSVVLYDVPENMLIRIYDNSGGSMNDDYLEIRALRDFEEEVVADLETNYSNANVQVTYHDDNGLNGKVSRLEVGCEGECDIPQRCEINPLDIQINEISAAGCEDANGKLSVSVLSGGIPPFEYRWNKIGNNNDRFFIGINKSISDLETGLYMVQVSDARGCAIFEEIELSATLDIESRVYPASCGESDGRISLTPEGASPYSYQWSHQPNPTSAATNLSVGSYTVTVTDANNCSKIETYEIEEDINFRANVRGKNTTSCNTNDGWAEVQLTGLEGEPSILWSTGDTIAKIEGLAPGIYTVLILDGESNCSVEKSIRIRQPSVNITGGGTRIYMPGATPSATLTASISGCSGCTYMWSTGETGRSITVSESGTYTVTVDDGNGCIYEDTQSVTFVEASSTEGENGNPDGGGTPPGNCENCPDDGNGNCSFWQNIIKTLLGLNGCPPKWGFPVLHAFDPNDIAGNIGYEEDRWVSVNERLGYVIRFENDPEFATGPAQTVTVRHPLDPNVDPYTLRLGDFGFGNFNFSVPPNSITYNGRLDVSDSLGVLVDVIAGIDVQNNEAFWILKSIDPATVQTPIDASLGFLEVTDTTITRFNDSIPKPSEGFVSFSIMPNNQSITGDTVMAQASIIFDQNAPIETNIWKNTIDAFPPISTMNPVTYDQGLATLTWTGQDDPGGVGIQNYSIYYSVNGGEFELLASEIPGNTYIFEGEVGNTYEFFTIAKDHVNNIEALKTKGEVALIFNGRIDFDIKVLLEGAYNADTSEMTTVLNTSRGLLPGQTPASNLAVPTLAGQPYNRPPWDYEGTEGVNWTDADYPAEAVDWVLVSFRTDIQKNTEIGITAALLLKDGTVQIPETFALPTGTNTAYIVIEHRNHVGVMTPQAVDVENNTLTHNFIIADSYDGNGTGSGQKQLPTGEWVMFAGDADQSDFPSYDVLGSDKILWETDNGNFDYYTSPDFNMDGDVNGADKAIWFENNGISSRVPK